MKYTIFSIDNRRQAYTSKIRNHLRVGWQEVATECVNGSDAQDLELAMKRHGYRVNYDPALGTTNPKVGHLGIWHTVLNSFEHAPHVTFEDDAILGNNFKINFLLRSQQLPEDTDFFSLFIPRDSDHLWNESMSVSSMLTRTYSKYGGVSMFYTKQGTEKIKSLLERDGILGQYDNVLYHYARLGELNGYCSKPTVPDLVRISGKEQSIVQESEEYAR